MEVLMQRIYKKEGEKEKTEYRDAYRKQMQCNQYKRIKKIKKVILIKTKDEVTKQENREENK